MSILERWPDDYVLTRDSRREDPIVGECTSASFLLWQPTMMSGSASCSGRRISPQFSKGALWGAVSATSDSRVWSGWNRTPRSGGASSRQSAEGVSL